jgi:hypothetical protein
MRKLKVILMAINKFGYGINDKHPKTNISNIVEFSKCGEIIWLSYTCKNVFLLMSCILHSSSQYAMRAIC